jgi:hypothetical protein
MCKPVMATAVVKETQERVRRKAENPAQRRQEVKGIMKRTLALVASLALGAALNLTAQDAAPQEGGRGFGPGYGRGPHGPGPGPHGPPPIVAMLDVDRDGILSNAEIGGAPAKLLALDANQDGQLTREEMCPRPEGAPPAGKGPGPGKGEIGKGKGKGPMGPPPCLRILDTNDDQVISAEEIQNSPTALLSLDANQDGQLGPGELAPRDGRRGPPPPQGQQEQQ